MHFKVAHNSFIIWLINQMDTKKLLVSNKGLNIGKQVMVILLT